jgi:hypothetical protein
LRRQPARPFYFALWPSGHSSDAANLVPSSGGACSARPFSRASKTPAVDHDAFCYCAQTLSAKRASFVINVNVNASTYAAIHTWAAVYRAVRSSPHTTAQNYKGAGRLLSTCYCIDTRLFLLTLLLLLLKTFSITQLTARYTKG